MTKKTTDRAGRPASKKKSRGTVEWVLSHCTIYPEVQRKTGETTGSRKPMTKIGRQSTGRLERQLGKKPTNEIGQKLSLVYVYLVVYKVPFKRAIVFQMPLYGCPLSLHICEMPQLFVVHAIHNACSHLSFSTPRA